MSLHGLAEMRLGVPNVEATRQFYCEFGLAEYYADLDQIPEDAEWDARDWAPDKALYAWGPAVPKAFVHPDDVDDIAAALQGVS